MISVFAGCSSVQPEKPPETIPAAENEQKLRPIDCTASMLITAGSPVASLDSGSVLTYYDPFPDGFDNLAVVKTKSTYFYQGKTAVSEYELSYIGVIPESQNSNPASRPTQDNKKNPEDVRKFDAQIQAAQAAGLVTKGRRLGTAAGTRVLLNIRSKSLDPYLLACSSMPPVFENGYWYFFPGTYVSTEMKWLSYEPADERKFRDMFSRALPLSKQNFVPLRFTWWRLLETRLSEYPEPAQKNGKEYYTQPIEFKGMPLTLTFQPEVTGRLKKEYTIGEPVYLYLHITGIQETDGSGPYFDCSVRNFSLISPEKIIENRLHMIITPEN